MNSLQRHRAATNRSGALASPNEPTPDKPGESNLPAGMGETVDLITKRLVTHLAPVVQNDPAMQTRVGSAIGAGLAPQISGPVTLAAVAVSAAAGVAIWKMLA